MGESVSLILWTALRTRLSYWDVLSSLNIRAFVLSYCILFFPVWLSYFESLLFSVGVMERESGSEDGEGGESCEEQRVEKLW